MELILINDAKLKIMLTEQDMVHYDLDCSCANYDNTETRRAFWSILDEAKHRTGFDAASDRVFIQMYPSKEGGCEMYVTKVGLLCASTEKAKKKKESTVEQTKILFFVFDSLRNLLEACRSVCFSAIIPPSRAFIDDLGTCYLLLDSSVKYDITYLCSIINEYGRQAQADIISAYIEEHGKIICPDKAIEVLSVF